MERTEYPKNASREWEDFAILEAAVVNESPLDGNSGTSSFVLDFGAGMVDARIQAHGEPPVSAHLPHVVLTFSGTSEHRLVIESLRFIADKLEEFTTPNG